MKPIEVYPLTQSGQDSLIPALMLCAPPLLVAQNLLRAAINTAVMYTAAVLMLLVFRPGVDGLDPDSVLSWQTNCTIAMVAGLLPMRALALGAAACHLRLHHATKTIVHRLR